MMSFCVFAETKGIRPICMCTFDRHSIQTMCADADLPGYSTKSKRTDFCVCRQSYYFIWSGFSFHSQKCCLHLCGVYRLKIWFRFCCLSNSFCLVAFRMTSFVLCCETLRLISHRCQCTGFFIVVFFCMYVKMTFNESMHRSQKHLKIDTNIKKTRWVNKSQQLKFIGSNTDALFPIWI